MSSDTPPIAATRDTPVFQDVAPTVAPLTLPADTLVAGLIEKYRFVLIGLCLCVLLGSFNGQWRIGRDSALYRGLAESLANGRGYQFGEFATNTAYPGLPVLLAAIQKTIGRSMFAPWPSVLMIVSFALVGLWVTYRLIRLHYPPWVATCVTCGVALNARYLQLSHELLTDIPFYCGLVSALYEWERLRLAESRGAFGRAMIITAGGLLLAASIRPTFWILAICWIGVAGFKLLRHRNKAAVAALSIIVAVIVFVIAVDPRTRNWRIFEGGYEQEFLTILTDVGASTDSRLVSLPDKLRNNIPRLLGENFPELFLGTEFPFGGNYFVSAVLLICSITLIRRHPMWGWLVILTVGITLMLSTTPRYYLMVLPFLLLGWLRYCNWLRFGSVGVWGNLVLLYGLGFVTVMNAVKAVPFVIEQRRTPFVQTYRDGKYTPAIGMAELIRRHVPRTDAVISPEASVVAYLSGRKVYMQRELLPPKRPQRQYADILAAHGITWGVLPAAPYREDDPDIARLIERRVIRKTQHVESSGPWTLARIEVMPPPADVDWRTLPIALHDPEVLAARKAAEARKAAAARKAAKERRELAARKLDRQRKLEAAERRAAAERKAAADRKSKRLERERKEQVARARAAKERRFMRLINLQLEWVRRLQHAQSARPTSGRLPKAGPHERPRDAFTDYFTDACDPGRSFNWYIAIAAARRTGDSASLSSFARCG